MRRERRRGGDRSSTGRPFALAIQVSAFKSERPRPRPSSSPSPSTLYKLHTPIHLSPSPHFSPFACTITLFRFMTTAHISRQPPPLARAEAEGYFWTAGAFWRRLQLLGRRQLAAGMHSNVPFSAPAHS